MGNWYRAFLTVRKPRDGSRSPTGAVRSGASWWVRSDVAVKISAGNHTATLLNNNKVLIAGGFPTLGGLSRTGASYSRITSCSIPLRSRAPARLQHYLVPPDSKGESHGGSVPIRKRTDRRGEVGFVLVDNERGNIPAPVEFRIECDLFYTTATLPPGTDHITATYDGDSYNLPSVSPILNRRWPPTVKRRFRARCFSTRKPTRSA